MTIKTNVQTLANRCFKYSEITVSHFQIHAVLATVLFFLFCTGSGYLTVAGQQWILSIQEKEILSEYLKEVLLRIISIRYPENSFSKVALCLKDAWSHVLRVSKAFQHQFHWTLLMFSGAFKGPVVTCCICITQSRVWRGTRGSEWECCGVFCKAAIPWSWFPLISELVSFWRSSLVMNQDTVMNVSCLLERYSLLLSCLRHASL